MTEKRSERNTHDFFDQFTTPYDPMKIREVYDGLVVDFGEPISTLGTYVLQQIAITYIRLLRCQRIEADKIREVLDPPEYSDPLLLETAAFAKRLVAANSKAPIDGDLLSRSEALLLRYEPRLFKRFERLLNYLKKAKD